MVRLWWSGYTLFVGMLISWGLLLHCRMILGGLVQWFCCVQCAGAGENEQVVITIVGWGRSWQHACHSQCSIALIGLVANVGGCNPDVP